MPILSAYHVLLWTRTLLSPKSCITWFPVRRDWCLTSLWIPPAQMPATRPKVKFLSEHLFHSHRNWRWKRPEDIWSIPVVVQEKWLEQNSLLTSCSQDSISVLGAERLHTHCNEDAEQILFTDLKKYLEALHFHKMIGSEMKESVGVPR